MPTIRDFEASDQDTVRWLIIEGLGEHWGSIDLNSNQDLNDIAGSFGHGRTLVAETDLSIVGTGTILPRPARTAEILRMSVARQVRGHGIGQIVCLALIETARTWGYERVILETASIERRLNTFGRSGCQQRRFMQSSLSSQWVLASKDVDDLDKFRSNTRSLS